MRPARKRVRRSSRVHQHGWPAHKSHLLKRGRTVTVQKPEHLISAKMKADVVALAQCSVPSKRWPEGESCNPKKFPTFACQPMPWRALGNTLTPADTGFEVFIQRLLRQTLDDIEARNRWQRVADRQSAANDPPMQQKEPCEPRVRRQESQNAAREIPRGDRARSALEDPASADRAALPEERSRWHCTFHHVAEVALERLLRRRAQVKPDSIMA